MSNPSRNLALFFFFLFFLFSFQAHSQLTEKERRIEYHRRGNSWPPKYLPDSKGWANLYEQRFDQVMRLDNHATKWDGWVVSTISGLTVPNLTENGWGLTGAPNDIVQDLRDAIHTGLDKARPEHPPGIIMGRQPIFIDREDLLQRVLHELQPIAEAWVGMKLIPHQAYGFRLYRNESRLLMHIDKTDTHVVSFILHIDSSEDSEPWPIVIEDYQGNTNEVVLASGDMLLYESAKCFHGRPYEFRGSWYTSVFVHYYPVHWEEINSFMSDAHYAIPPFWRETPTSARSNPLLELRASSLSEPECEDTWCNLKNSVKYEGPGEEGYVLTTGGKKSSLYNDGENEF